MSINSKTARPTPTSTPVLSNQSQQKRQQKKTTDERVTLFAHLSIYTCNLERLPITS
jgi:hypothetical protein